MKILQVVPFFPPAYAFGGPVKVAFQLSRELVKRGHEVVVWTSDAKDRDSRLALESVRVVDGIKVHYMRNLSMITIKKSNLFIIPELVSKAKKEIKEFDVIHLHGYRGFQNIVIHHYAKKYGISYVLQAHGSLPRIMIKKRLKLIYDVFLGYRWLRDASSVIALSQIEAEQYRGMGVPEEKIVIIPNGIDLSEYVNLPIKGEFKKKFKIPEENKIILYLGRIHRTKGIEFLVRSYAHLVDDMEYKDTILLIAGSDDGYLEEAKSLASSLGLNRNILFTGLLLEKDKISAYIDSEICTYLNPNEPFGLVPLEAASCRTPVIVCTKTYMSQVVNEGKFGSSIKYGDINDLAGIMEKMLDDETLLREMGEKGRKFVFENYDWADIVTNFEKAYEVMRVSV